MVTSNNDVTKNTVASFLPNISPIASNSVPMGTHYSLPPQVMRNAGLMPSPFTHQRFPHIPFPAGIYPHFTRQLQPGLAPQDPSVSQMPYYPHFRSQFGNQKDLGSIPGPFPQLAFSPFPNFPPIATRSANNNPFLSNFSRDVTTRQKIIEPGTSKESSPNYSIISEADNLNHELNQDSKTE